MQIRKIDKTEIPEVAAFYDEVVRWLEGSVNYPKWVSGVYPSLESVEEMTETDGQFVCTEDGEIVVAFGLNDRPQGAFEKGKWEKELNEGEYLVIHALAIKPDVQKKGIGSEVVQFCVRLAKEKGFKAIRLDVVPSNLPAKRLFLKNGFRYVGDVDLEMGIEGIPEFSLYELDFI